MEPTDNKSIVEKFYRQVVRERKSELISLYVSEDYIQHSPMGKGGREGLFEMVEFLKTLPKPSETEKSPIMRLIEEDDLVVVHLDLHFMGKNVRVIELFRIQDGKAAEHWDVTEEQNSETKPFIKLPGDMLIADKQIFLRELYAKLNVNIHRMITEGDLIAVHAEAKDGEHAIALFDIFNFEDGKLHGHWSTKQKVPEKIMHNNGMF